jgi:isoleucyl-tRNA synthetase
MSAEPRSGVPDVARLERGVRERWRQRGVGGARAGGQGGGPAWAVHTCTTADPRRTAAARAAALVAADAVARHRAMGGAAVEVVGTVADDSLRAELACLPADCPADPASAAYVDSVWWSLAQLWEAGLLVEQPHRSAWCPRCGAVRGAGEVRGVVTDATGALVRFPVVGDHELAVAGASLLVDVTAPWTVPATTAVAVAVDAAPVLAQAVGDDYPVVIDRSAVEPVLGADAMVHRAVAIDELARVRYRPPVPLTGPAPAAARDVVVVVEDAPVATTGLAPVAPATDVDALRIAMAHAVAVVDPVEPDGTYAAPVTGHAGTTVADADARVTAALAADGLVLRTTPVRRRTARCQRCDAPVLPRARRSWVVATSTAADRLAAERAVVRGQDAGGDAARWAAGAADWPVSRAHARGVPLPAWRCGTCAWTTVVAGRAELAGLVGRTVAEGDVDAVAVPCPDCGGVAHRLPFAVDPRYVAACLPFARFGFPRVPGSDALLARHSHAQLLVDADGGAAGWADAATALATLLWNAAGHDAVLRTTVGIDAALVARVDRDGVDVARWTLLVGRDDADATGRLHGVWTHAVALLVDAGDRGWTPADAAWAPDVDRRGVLHRWVLAELAATVRDVDDALAGDAPAASAARITAWLDALEWYLEATAGAVVAEPDVALATRHECLVTTAALLAPLTPLLADELFELLVRGDDPTTPGSIHRLRFPTPDPVAVDPSLCATVAAVRRLVELGDRARRRAAVADDLVLPEAVVRVPPAAHAAWPTVARLACRLLRVGEVHRFDDVPAGQGSRGRWQVAEDDTHTVALDLAVEDARRSARLAREVVTAVHRLRRDQALAADQRITVRIDAEPEVSAAVEVHRQEIADDVRATHIELGPTEHGVAVPVGDHPARVAVRGVASR